MRIHGLWVLLLTGLTSLVESTHAQPRSELYMCAPTCREAMPQVYTAYCDLILDFEAGEGRTLWGPLLNTGPVKVGIQATPFGEPVETLPLIVQVRVGEGETTCPPFEDGRFVFQTSGTVAASCESLWAWSPILRLEDLGIPTGTEYWVQLLSQFHPGPVPENPQGAACSPLRACVKIEEVTVAVEAVTWTRVKSIFRD